ncbi:MAG: class IV adenylate cyclase [Candidatus Woesearchaeota archaeon]|jgi:adenylate cyclase class 2
MAQNNTEIEIKIEVTEKEFKRVKKTLKQIAKYMKESHQVDEYFTPAHRNFIEPKKPIEWLRIGERGGKIILNYKHFYKNEEGMTTHCDEYETEVNDKQQLDFIFKAINMKSLAIVDKTRETYIYNEKFEIALDIVKNLGYFIEIEALKHNESVEKTRQELFEIAEKIGIDNPKETNKGYPFILMERNSAIKKL